MAKKNKNVKELNLEFENLSERIKILEEKDASNLVTSDKVDGIEDILKQYDDKIKSLDELLKQAEIKKDEHLINKSKEQKVKCRDCGKEFDKKEFLKEHIKENHKQNFNCNFCQEIFVKCSEMEEHLKKMHNDATQYKCEECDKAFVVEWRLRKHMNLHEGNISIKNCHFFNNNLECPYEYLGCMFRHNKSKECKFGKNCRIKLCQFQHNAITQGKAPTDEEREHFKCELCDFKTYVGEELTEHKVSKHPYEKFDKMEEWERYEVNDYMCYYICWQGDHKCFEKEEENELIGVDVKKIKEDYRNGVYEECFKC